MEHFQYAPETGKCGYSKYRAPEYAAHKTSPYGEDDAGGKEGPPDFYSKVILALYYQRVIASYNQKGNCSYKYSVPVHIVNRDANIRSNFERVTIWSFFLIFAMPDLHGRSGRLTHKTV